MKRHFQCVEQVKSPSNLTKYCTCHAKWMSSMICVTYETSFPMRGATSNLTKYCACHENLKLKISADTPWMLPPIERRFDDNPRIKSSSRTRRFGDLTRPILETILYCKIQHFASRLFPKMSRSAAPVTKSHPPTSPNTAPATQNECHQWSASNMKPHFQCVEQVKSPSNLTKYCACHENLKLKISADTPWMLPPIERRFDDNPRIKSSSRTRRFGAITTSANTAPATQNECQLYGTITITWLMCYFTELVLCGITITLLMCYFTELVLCGTVSGSITLLICDFTDVLLYGTITLRNC